MRGGNATVGAVVTMKDKMIITCVFHKTYQCSNKIEFVGGDGGHGVNYAWSSSGYYIIFF